MKVKHLLMAIIALSVVIGVVYYLISISAASGVPQNNGQTVFEGKLLYSKFSAQTLNDSHVLSDNGCKTDPRNGLSNCTAGIETQYGTLYFDYEHDMMINPCLSSGDIVNIDIAANDTAEVTRTYWGGGGT